MDNKDFKNLVKQRDNLIALLNAKFEGTVQDAQKSMLNAFMKGFVDMLQIDENGNIAQTSFNRNLLLSIDKLFTDYAKKHHVAILAQLVQGVGAVLNFNNKYYSNLSPKTDLLPLKEKVVNNMRGWLGIDGDKANENGYLSTLVKNDTVKNQLKDLSMRAVYSQKGWQQTKKDVEDFIEGKDEKSLGALQKYYRNYTYDLYSQIDRATGKTYADDLKFEFAIYEGGLIETSRPFCEEHNGNVYHISEILKFDPPTAKQPNYNPITDLGGYACRHHLNWIPTSMALALRPDAKNLVGTGVTGLVKPTETKKEEKKPVEKKAPAVEKPKAVEPKETTKPKFDPSTKFDDIKPLKIAPFKPSKEFEKGIDEVAKLGQEHTELRGKATAALNEYNDIVATLNKMMRAGKGSSKEYKDLLADSTKKANEYNKQRKEIVAKGKAIEKDGAEYFAKMLEGLTKSSNVEATGTLSPKQKEVFDIFKKISAGYNEGTTIKFSKVSGRAHYIMKDNTVHLAASSDKYTILHELGHSLERNNHVMKAAVEFLEKRTKGNPIEKLKKLNKAFRDDEKYKEGGFFNPYVGKVYQSQLNTTQKYKDYFATEVISMGLEQMMRNPRLFYKQDKEHFELIYNLFFKQ